MKKTNLERKSDKLGLQRNLVRILTAKDLAVVDGGMEPQSKACITGGSKVECDTNWCDGRR